MTERNRDELNNEPKSREQTRAEERLGFGQFLFGLMPGVAESRGCVFLKPEEAAEGDNADTSAASTCG